MPIRVVSRWVALVALWAMATAFPSFTFASTILSDDFSGASLDTTKWSTYLFDSSAGAHASVTQASGHAVITNRGYLVTANQYNPDTYGGITITGTWTATTTANDAFAVITRSTAVANTQGYGEAASGLEFKFWAPSAATALQVIADGSAISVSNVVTTGALTLVQNASYTFTVVDNGTKGLSFTMTQTDNTSNTATVTATLVSDSSASNYIAFHNREFEGVDQISYLSNVTISSNAIPEPGTAALLITGLFALLAYAWRKRK